MERYFEKAGIIQAWGKLDRPSQRGRMIIDCRMNLPLLYWATEETRKPEYRRAAISHAQQSARYLIREDSSTYHTYYMDVESGEPRFGQTSQGYADHSCWSRGQAWAIYGMPLSYAYTKEETRAHDAERVTNYYLNRSPEDYVCYWDLIFTEGQERGTARRPPYRYAECWSWPSMYRSRIRAPYIRERGTAHPGVFKRWIYDGNAP